MITIVRALLDPNDEVIVFEPFYDSYTACIELAGAKVTPVTLHAPHFNFDLEELKKAFTDKTKLVIINSPHNPSGKVFSKDELNEIAKLCIEYDTFCLSDEVYEHLLYEKSVHVPMASIKGMKERTVTVSSCGKTFGITGWKVGWTMAPENITHAIRMVHQFNSFSVPHPLQVAVASSLEKLDHYLIDFKKIYTHKRNLFIDGLKEAGYNPLVPQGTYFIMCPIGNVTNLNDVDYSMELIKKKKVAAIPPSAFYLKSNEGQQFLRFCFAKKDETLLSALKNLKEL